MKWAMAVAFGLPLGMAVSTSVETDYGRLEPMIFMLLFGCMGYIVGTLIDSPDDDDDSNDTTPEPHQPESRQ